MFIIILSIILIGLLIGIILGFVLNNKNNNNKKDVFTEIPFEYKLPVSNMGSCSLIDSDSNELCPKTLSYEDTVAKFGGIWKVDPLSDKTQSMCNSDCAENIPNYSYAKPKWNWIIGTCKGKNCGNPQSYNAYKEAKNHGTDLIVNYVGSYQYDPQTNNWICQQDSSFNMDGKYPAQDIMKNEQNWLPGPLPGGSANWGEGYYPAGRSGVGAPAFAFIISVEKIFNTAWYIINQSTLDRGPSNLMPSDILVNAGLSEDESKNVTNNTWQSARSGEWDLLESTILNDENQDKNKNYLKLYSNTSSNVGSSGFCLQHGKGTDGNQNGGWYSSKFFMSDDYNSNKSKPRVFFAIIDLNGTTIFQIPTYEGAPEYWKGIGRKSALMTIPGKFTGDAPITGACDDPTKFCATFMPSCTTANEECVPVKANFDNIFTPPVCGNFIKEKLVSTHNVWGQNKAFNEQVEWTKEMQT
jgi:hypothetical protein